MQVLHDKGVMIVIWALGRVLQGERKTKHPAGGVNSLLHLSSHQWFCFGENGDESGKKKTQKAVLLLGLTFNIGATKEGKNPWVACIITDDWIFSSFETLSFFYRAEMAMLPWILSSRALSDWNFTPHSVQPYFFSCVLLLSNATTHGAKLTTHARQMIFRVVPRTWNMAG